MNQVPCIPQCPQVPQYYPAPQAVQQPNYNAVKIDIHNPSVGVPGYPQPQYQQPTAPIYEYPQLPVYNYPTAQAPQAYPPVCLPQPPVVPTTPATPVAPAVVPAPVTSAAEVPQQPVVIQQQNNNGPVAAQPVEVKPTPVPAPQVSKPEVVEPKVVVPKLDLNAFVARLTNPDFEVQAGAMEDIATIIKDRKNPEKQPDALQASRVLVDTKIYNELENIINFDSSKLEGPTQAQIEARQKILKGEKVTADEEKLANTMAPKEQAERNKSYALFTMAIMNEMYADEVAHLPESSIPPLTALPKINVLVDQLKDNPNPMVRSSAIEALSYIQTPEYKKDLTTLFTVAKNDVDAGVVQSANAALKKLDLITA